MKLTRFFITLFKTGFSGKIGYSTLFDRKRALIGSRLMKIWEQLNKLKFNGKKKGGVEDGETSPPARNSTTNIGIRLRQGLGGESNTLLTLGDHFIPPDLN